MLDLITQAADIHSEKVQNWPLLTWPRERNSKYWRLSTTKTQEYSIRPYVSHMNRKMGKLYICPNFHWLFRVCIFVSTLFHCNSCLTRDGIAKQMLNIVRLTYLYIIYIFHNLTLWHCDIYFWILLTNDNDNESILTFNGLSPIFKLNYHQQINSPTKPTNLLVTFFKLYLGII